MKRLRERPEISGELGMSSMTDIIFILLIFFMMVSTLVNPSALTLTVPGNAKATGKAVTTNTRTDDIGILADGQFTLNNAVSSVAQIKKALESAKIKNPNYKVSISPNPQAPVEKVVIILDMTQNMGISSTLHAEVTD